MASKDLIKAVESYHNYAKLNKVDDNFVRNYYVPALKVALDTEKDIPYALRIGKEAKGILQTLCMEKTGADIFTLHEFCKEHSVGASLLDVWWEILDREAPYFFDSYLLALEKDREAQDRFYLPKRDILLKHGLIQTLQDLEDDKLDIASISMPPSTQKTTLEKFFASWICGKAPKDFSLFVSHSGDITKMFYEGVLDITTNTEEYRWNDIFAGVKLLKTDANRQQINFFNPKPYANLQCTSIGAKNAGKVRANKFLYCDDLIGGIEEALNKTRLDKLWTLYNTDLIQRKMDHTKEIHIATRWNVEDPIGHLKVLNAGSDRARFIAIPDIDPKTGESNFNYKYNGISKEFFHNIEKTMDPISYQALYKNDPVYREGLLYALDEMRRYTKATFPARQPDGIYGICDVKNKGTDYMFLPAFARFDDDFYLIDCVCDNSSDYELQYSKLTNLILSTGMHECPFESNNGGDRVSWEVDKRVRKAGGTCKITDKPTETNKETRILVNSDWVKKHIIFRDESLYTPKDDYGVMMGWLGRYTTAGKNAHDDVPDGLALFAQRWNKPVVTIPQARVIVGGLF